jgi:hypothetical protein
MGLRGPKGRTDEIARLLGYPSHRRRTLGPRLPTRAELMAAAAAAGPESPLGFLEKNTRPDADRRRAKPAKGQAS